MYHQWRQVDVKAIGLEMRVREQEILLCASGARKLAMCRGFFPQGQKRQYVSNQPFQNGRSFVCQFSDQSGHSKRGCPERAEWPKRKEKSAMVTEREPVLSTIDSGNIRHPTLPKIHVHGVNETDENRQLILVVDSGSTRTLISRYAAYVTGAKVMPYLSNALIGVNRTDGFVDGVVSTTLEGDDIHVKLPRVTVNALVVPDLSSVNADLLIGIDVVSRTGGLQLRYGDDGSLSNVIFGDSEPVEPNDSDFVAMAVPVPKLSRHIVVSSERDDVSLEADDFRASWDSTEKCWAVEWKWVGDKPPTRPVGSGVGEYSRKRKSSNFKMK